MVGLSSAEGLAGDERVTAEPATQAFSDSGGAQTTDAAGQDKIPLPVKGIDATDKSRKTKVILAIVAFLALLNILFYIYYTYGTETNPPIENNTPGKLFAGMPIYQLPPTEFPEKDYVTNCEGIPVSQARTECLQQYGLAPVVNCEEKPTRHERSVCYNTYVKAFGDTSKCDILNVMDRDDCYLTAATDELEPSLCDNIQMHWERIVCYSAVAATDNDTKACDTLPDSSFLGQDYAYLYPSWVRDACYTGVTATSYDLGACNKVVDPEFRIYCNAIGTNNNTLCASLTKDYRIEKCLRDCWQVNKARHTPHVAIPNRTMIPYIHIFEIVGAGTENGKNIFKEW